MTGPREDLLADLRPTAFGIAYRMLGSVAEAEDVVQETLLRVHRSLEAGEEIESPRAYAATIATRLAIDALRSARARRETYVGEWLPEPLVGEPVPYAAEPPADPERAAEMADSLSLAFLVVLERLTPEQRAVLLLRDAFDYPYEEIAQIIGKSLDATRQLALRARRHVEERRPRFEASRERRDELARRFIEAAQGGDLDSLEHLLAHDVVLRGDGGGKAPALARSLHGRARVAKTLRAWGRQLLRHPGAAMELVQVNGGPGALTRDEHGDIISVLALDIADGQIQAINGIVNPDKLARIGPVADAWAFLGRRPG